MARRDDDDEDRGVRRGRDRDDSDDRRGRDRDRDDDRGSRRASRDDDDRPARSRDRDRDDDDRGDRDRGRSSSRDDDDRDRGRNKSRSKGGYEYKERDEEETRRHANQSTGNWDNIVPDKFKQFKPKEGLNIIRFLPPPTKPDLKYYAHEYHRHENIGADEGQYVCLDKTLNKACPICEDRTSFSGEDAKELRAKRRWIAWVIDRNAEREGPMWFDMSPTMDREVTSQCIDRYGKVTSIDHPEDGYDIEFTRTGTKLNTRYTGYKLDRDPSPLHDNPDKADDWLAYIEENRIDNLVIIHDYEYLKKVFAGQISKSDRDGDDDEKGGGRRERMDRGRGKSRDDDKDDARPSRSRSRSRDDDDDRGSRGRSMREELDDEIPEHGKAKEDDDDRGSRRRSRDRDDDKEDDRGSSRRSRDRDDDKDDDRPSKRERSRRDDDDKDDDRPAKRERMNKGRDDDDDDDKGKDDDVSDRTRDKLKSLGERRKEEGSSRGRR